MLRPFPHPNRPPLLPKTSPKPTKSISLYFSIAANPIPARSSPLDGLRFPLSRVLISGGSGELAEEKEEEEEGLCPVDCVREFKTEEEFQRILEKAREQGALVVVDFYRTSCGSCKYIEQGFIKLCKGSGDEEAAVVFLKHNVIDEYDEQSDVAERLRIKAVPLFQFYRDGILLESFATRDKERVLATIHKHASPSQL